MEDTLGLWHRVQWRFSKCNLQVRIFPPNELQKAKEFLANREWSTYTDVKLETVSPLALLLKALDSTSIVEALDTIEGYKEDAEWCELYR